MKFKIIVSIILIFSFCSMLHPVEIKVETKKIIRQLERHRLLGVNIAIWHEPTTFIDPKIVKLFKDLKPGFIRMPGGSLSDYYFWNGNGVRLGNNIPNSLDISKYHKYQNDGKTPWWDIDYSDWAPGFLGFSGFPKEPEKANYNSWHGNCDVKQQLDFIKSIGARAYITVNAGTGTARDAAEWVKWANKKMGYNVKYWEIGNELYGEWENGHIRPDGSKINGKIYANILKEFSIAMKKEDPSIKIVAQIDDKWVKDLMEIAGDYVDAIAIHEYYTTGTGNLEQMWAVVTNHRKWIRTIKDEIRKTRPDKVDKIEIVMSEYNCKLNEDIWTANLFSGLFVTAVIGDIIENGMDMAMLWDAFTQKENIGGGHGFIIAERAIPKAAYWGMKLYNDYFGNNLLKTTCDSPKLKAYSSKNEKGEIFLIVVNTDPDNSITATVKLDSANIAETAEYARFSRLEYRWDPDLFLPVWSLGPTRIITSVANSFDFKFPPFSAIAFKFTLKDAVKKEQLSVLGPEETVIITGSEIPLEIKAMDSAGNPAKNTEINITVLGTGLKVSGQNLKTDMQGKAKINLIAGAKPDKVTIKIAMKNLTIEHPVSIVSPYLKMIVPDKVPFGQNIKLEIFACYGEGEGKPLENFKNPCKLTVTCAEMPGKFSMLSKKESTQPKEISGKFEAGLATFDIKPERAGQYELKITVGNIVASKKIVVYEEQEIEKVVFQFNDDSEMLHMGTEGKISPDKGKFKFDYTVRANQGVFSIDVTGFQGWQQGYWIIKDCEKINTVEWSKVVGMTVEYMVPEDFSDGGDWANVIFVFQAFGSWWMPLQEVPISGVEKGKWHKVKLMIPPDKPEWLESMKSFTKIFVVFNSGKTLKGNLYFDNIGFIEKIEK